MRRTAVEMAALAALLLGGALASGQEATPPAVTPPAAAPPPAGADKPKAAPAKSKLEEMLQKALQDNPDVRVAAARVAEAEAKLNRARLQAVQKVGAAYQAVEAQKATVQRAASELERMKQYFAQKAVDQRLVDEHEQLLIDAKAKLAALETELPYLLGKQPANSTMPPGGAMMSGGIGFPVVGGLNTGGGAVDNITGRLIDRYTGRLIDPNADGTGPPVPVLGKTAERIRAALDKPYSLDLKETVLSDVIADVSEEFQKANPGLLIKCTIDPDELHKKALRVKFDQMPFGAVLVWIEDTVPNSGVVVRDYGLVIAPINELPPGAPSLHDFWKAAKAEEKTPEKDQSSKPPAEFVEGVVIVVDGTGIVHISIGRENGVNKGDTVDMYRMDAKGPEKTKYLGLVKIVEAAAKVAACQPLGKTAVALHAGDIVSVRIVGD